MTLDELMAAVAKAGITLTSKGGQLAISAPKGRLTEEIRAALAEHKSAVLVQLAGALQPKPLAQLFACTRDVERLHLLARARLAHPSALHVSELFVWHGEVPADDRVADALERFCSRVPALRTHFVMQGPTLAACVSSLGGPVLVHELLPARGEALERDVRTRYHQLVEQPFILDVGPLWRVALFRGADCCWLAIVAHHLVADAYSIDLLATSLAEGAAGKEFVEAAEASTQRRQRVVSWPEVLAGTNRLLTRQPAVASEDKQVSVRAAIPTALREAIRNTALAAGVFPSAVQLAAAALVLGRWRDVDCFNLAVPCNTRLQSGRSDELGFLSSPLPVRIDLSDATCAVLLGQASRELLRNVDAGATAGDVLDALSGSDVRVEGAFDVLVNFLRIEARQGPASALTPTFTAPRYSDTELHLLVVEQDDQAFVELRFAEDRLHRAGGFALVEAMLIALASLSDLAKPVTEISLPGLDSAMQRRFVVGLAATFTADLLVQPICTRGWQLGAEVEVRSGGYNQVLQQLLDPTSALHGGTDCKVVLFRLADVFRDAADPTQAVIQSWGDEFVAAIAGSVARMQAPYLIGVLPTEHSDLRFEVEERRILEAVSTFHGVHVLAVQDWPLSPGAGFSAVADREGHIPYRSETFSVFGARISRALYGMLRRPVKIVVVDADHTLWGGVVGEDGVDAVVLTGGYAALHRRLLALRDAGVVLAICSKNEVDLVEAVLARPDCALSVHDFVCVRASWQAKADVLVSMAKELGLGLGDFVFLDDNPVEIEAVRGRLPEVLAIGVPDAETLRHFVENLWVLDLRARTEEDRHRAQRLIEEGVRSSAAQAHTNYLAFLEGLALEVDIAPLVQTGVARAAQLTQRTNQFNLRTKRRTAAELEQRLAAQHVASHMLRVSDRFGDYGVVGLVSVQRSEGVLEVNELMLSCRVLARGVEHRLLAWLAEQAEAAGVSTLRFRATATERNTPALAFLKQLATISGASEEGDVHSEWRVELPASAARSLPLSALVEGADRKDDTSVRRTGRDRKREGTGLVAVALEGADRATPRSEVDPAQLADAIAARFASTLGLGEVSVHDRYDSLGGSSLKAVLLVADLSEMLDVDVGMDDLLVAMTPHDLAERLTLRVDPVETAVDLPDQVSRDLALISMYVPFQTIRWRAQRSEMLLITGGTGFLGSFLAMALLRRTNAKVLCLVRARDDAEATQRLREAFEQREILWSTALEARLTAVSGNFAAPKFGWNPDTWERRCAEVDGVYHCGASVQFTQPYEALRSANVLGTLHTLQFAAEGRLKRYHLISTIGVTRQHDGGRAVLETEPVPPVTELPMGYQQSKWVAERLVSEAGTRGVPITIFRPGAIGPHSHTGIDGEGSMLSALFRSADRDGLMPTLRFVAAVPVDVVARSIAGLGECVEHVGGVFHLTHPVPITGEAMLRQLRVGGWPVRGVSFDAWLAYTREAIASTDDHPLTPLGSLLEAPSDRSYLRQLITGPEVDCSAATRALATLGLEMPPMEPAGWQAWMRRVQAQGQFRSFDVTHAGERRRYLWFAERLRGFDTAGPDVGHRLDLDLVASVSSLASLASDRTFALEGTANLGALSESPMHIVRGHWTLRPGHGIGAADTDTNRVQLIRYEIELEAEDEARFILHGIKWGRFSPDLWAQSRTLDVEVFDSEGVLVLTGQTVVPASSYLPDQVQGLEFDPELTPAEQREATLLWFALLGANLSQSWFDVAARWVVPFLGRRR